MLILDSEHINVKVHVSKDYVLSLVIKLLENRTGCRVIYSCEFTSKHIEGINVHLIAQY